MKGYIKESNEKKGAREKTGKTKYGQVFFSTGISDVFFGCVYSGFRQEKQEIQTDPIQGINAQSSLKGYLGKGYAYGGQDKGNSRGRTGFIQQAQTLPEPTATPQEEKITPSPVPTVTSEDPKKKYRIRRIQPLFR